MKGMYFLLFLAQLLYAFSPNQPGIRLWDTKIYTINNIEIEITNYGQFRELTWPHGSHEEYLFGAGIWFGTIKEYDTLVTVGYGPHGAETEFAPGLKGQDPNDPEAVIYMYPAPWPAPIDLFPMAPQDTVSEQDSWCCYNDCDTTYHIPSDTWPIGIEVYQTGYAWNLTPLWDILFLFFEIRNISGYSIEESYAGIVADIDIGYESGVGNDICNGIVGKWYVIDGESLYIDDCGYQWQEEEEGGWSQFPAAVVFDLIQTPFKLIENEDADNDGILDQYERDSVYFFTYVPEDLWDVDKDGIPDWRDQSEIPQCGMTAFKRFTLNLEPNKDNERYMTLAGYNFKTGAYEPYDTIPPDPDDQRILMASGPFTLEPDSSVIIGIAVMCAKWYDIFFTPDSALVTLDHAAQYTFDHNWLLPGPPPAPHFTCIPGDAQVTLVWDNYSEITPDPYYAMVSTPGSSYDPFYREYDFEGYGLWKSMSGLPGEWDLLARCDLINGITFTDISNNIQAQDNGLFHTYVDTDVRNGFAYYYAVSAFDYNRVHDNDTTGPGYRALWFESGKVGQKTIPRRDPVDYIPAGAAELAITKGNPHLDSLFSGTVVSPFELSDDKPVYCEFGAPDTSSHDTAVQVIDTTVTPVETLFIELSVDAAAYTAYLKDETQQRIDSIHIIAKPADTYRSHEFMPINGIAISASCGKDEYPTIVTLFDSVHVEGTYPAQNVKGLECRLPIADVILHNGNWYPDTLYDHGFWAWRGNDYKVEWIKAYGTDQANSVVVTDVHTGDTIPYRRFQNNPETRHLGEGWCFTRHTSFGYPAWTTESHDTLRIYGTPATKTRSLYICGGLVALNNGAPMVDTVLPVEHDVWVVKANTDYLPSSVYGEVKTWAVPPAWSTHVPHLNVKVVPNPYLIHNEWQHYAFPRRVRFINLPSKCTIRIFNICGELVKVIRHVETTPYDEAHEVINNLGGDEWWDLLNMYRQQVSSGLYIFHIDSNVGNQVGKFVVID
jgi:hypothetical protein